MANYDWAQEDIQPTNAPPNQMMHEGYRVFKATSQSAKNPGRDYWKGGSDGRTFLGWVDEGSPKSSNGYRTDNRTHPYSKAPTQRQWQSSAGNPPSQHTQHTQHNQGMNPSVAEALAPVMALLTQQQSLMDEIRRDVKEIKQKALGETQEIAPPPNQSITEKAHSMGFKLKPITELGPEDTVFPMDS